MNKGREDNNTLNTAGNDAFDLNSRKHRRMAYLSYLPYHYDATTY